MSTEYEPSDDYGLLKRNYAEEPVGAVCGSYTGELASRDRWPERIARANERRAFPIHFHKFYNVPILDQTKFRYCWMFSVVAGMMNRYAFQGINEPVPYLSATAAAATGTGYNNRGGYISDAVRMIQEQGGVPTVDVWPQEQMRARQAEQSDIEKSRKDNQLTEFIDFGRDLDAAISAMTAETPIPCAFALPWWKHAVLGLEVIDTKQGRPESLDRYGIRFVNSYGPTWMETGFGEFYGDKMQSWEIIGISHVLPRDE